MLDRILDCGFTAVAVNEQPIWDERGNWRFFTIQDLTQTPGDCILKRLQDNGLSILLRVWGLAREDQKEHIAQTYSPNCLGPQRGTNYCLNSYEPKSADLLREMGTQLISQGIYDYADWVVVGWDDSGEVDDVRNLPEVGLMNQLLSPVRPQWDTIARTPLTVPRQPAGARTDRINDANLAIEVMFSALRAALGDSKPIGCMRGSQWHNQGARRTLPPAIGETASQSNDGNQLTESSTGGYGFNASPDLQRDSLRFSCDLLRGMNLDFACVEVDGSYEQPNAADRPLSKMVPPEPVQMYGGDDKDPWIAELYARAELCFRRGVSFQMTHWDYRTLGIWNTATTPQHKVLTDIEPLRTSTLLELGAPVEGVYAQPGSPSQPPLPDIPGCVTAWRAVFNQANKGHDELCVPVIYAR
jgi:hypothetical protein